MGCDIHFAVEKRIDGVWQRAEALVPNPWRKYDSPDEPQAEMRREEWYGSRNYNVFAMLADVRNGSGFAGSDTGDGFVPLAPHRGLPKDATDETREWLDEYYHSHTWFDLMEFFAYDLSQETKLRCLVNDVWPDSGKHWVPAPGSHEDDPGTWAGGQWVDHVKGMRGKAVAWEAIANWQREYPDRHWLGAPVDSAGGVSGAGAEDWLPVTYVITYQSAMEYFLPTVFRMARVAATECDGDLTAVRAVFAFDS